MKDKKILCGPHAEQQSLFAQSMLVTLTCVARQCPVQQQAPLTVCMITNPAYDYCAITCEKYGQYGLYAAQIFG